MLKKNVASLDDVEEKYRALYTKQADETYSLDNSILPDDSGLKNNNAALKQEKIKLQEKADALQAKIDADEEETLKGKNQYDTLLKKKEDAFKLKETASVQRAEKAEKALKTQMINAVVTEISASLAGESAALLKPHLKNRFSVEITDGVPKLSVLDKDGTPGMITKDQLIEEFKSDPMYAPILIGRNSSGGGSGGGSGAGGEEDAAVWDKFFDENNAEYSPTKQGELQKADKGLYDTLVKKYNLDDPYRV